MCRGQFDFGRSKRFLIQPRRAPTRPMVAIPAQKKTMLFNIFVRTKYAVASEEVNLRTVEQTDDDQQEEAYSLKPLFQS